MCGIAGFIQIDNQLNQSILELMLDPITHRGPDSNGIWFEENCYLGHKRLAILDLTTAGHQPMLSKNQNLVITYNGEIYNFEEVRQQLNQHTTIHWQGHSDTEVLLEAINYWGIETTLQKIDGMFAFAVWNRQTKELYLARDRFGEKPLYYSVDNQELVFASEITAIEQYPKLDKTLDMEAIGQYLRYMAIPSPFSIYKKVKKLPPGTYAHWKQGSTEPTIKPYWNTQQIFLDHISNPVNISEQEALERFDNLLQNSIQSRMVADVPVGSFLSGGFDSSLVTAIMQKLNHRPIETFSIGFDTVEHNEAEYAKAVAKHLGTHHNEFYVTGRDALKVVPKLNEIYDEPFADSSQIPMYLLSQETRNKVTVSLSGDAGDELFGGYTRYFTSVAHWQKYKNHSPYKEMTNLLRYCPRSAYRLLVPAIRQVLNNNVSITKLQQLSELLKSDKFDDFYLQSISTWRTPNIMAKGQLDLKQQATSQIDKQNFMMLTDALNYLPNDILTKVDRATMAVSLESRIPFLDKNIVQFAWSLPLDLKMKNNNGKYLLKQLAYKYIPKELLDRPKKGFGVPLDSWLRNDLREWGGDLLSESTLKRQGILNADLIQTIWQEQQNNQSDYNHMLWSVLMLQSWLDKRGI